MAIPAGLPVSLANCTVAATGWAISNDTAPATTAADAVPQARMNIFFAFAFIIDLSSVDVVLRLAARPCRAPLSRRPAIATSRLCGWRAASSFGFLRRGVISSKLVSHRESQLVDAVAIGLNPKSQEVRSGRRPHRIERPVVGIVLSLACSGSGLARRPSTDRQPRGEWNRVWSRTGETPVAGRRPWYRYPHRKVPGGSSV